MASKILISIISFLSISILAGWLIRQLMGLVDIYEKIYVDKTSRALIDMFIFMDSRKLFRLNLSVAVILLLIGLQLGLHPAYAVLWGAGGLALPAGILWYIKKKRINKFSSQLVDGLCVLTNGLRSGMSLVQAIETLENESVPPISQEFGLVIREYSVGVHIEKALDNLAERIPNPDLNLIVSSTNVVLGSGGNLVELFSKMADIIRERRKLELKIKTVTAQGKLQGLVVGFMPTALGGLMYCIDPLLMERMFTTTLGNIALGVMFAMQFTGYIMIKKITTITY